jgi:DNA-binding transcriptional regulator YhcF (GntR family)
MMDREEKLYLRVTRGLENDILAGIIREGEPVPSTNQYAGFYKINPATAAKGVGRLAEQGLLFKKRGLGLFVAEGAREKLFEARREAFRKDYLEPFLGEARLLGVSRQDLIAMLVSSE